MESEGPGRTAPPRRSCSGCRSLGGGHRPRHRRRAVERDRRREARQGAEEPSRRARRLARDRLFPGGRSPVRRCAARSGTRDWRTRCDGGTTSYSAGRRSVVKARHRIGNREGGHRLAKCERGGPVAFVGTEGSRSVARIGLRTRDRARRRAGSRGVDARVCRPVRPDDGHPSDALGPARGAGARRTRPPRSRVGGARQEQSRRGPADPVVHRLRSGVRRMQRAADIPGRAR